MPSYNFLFKNLDDKEIKIKGLGKVAIEKFKKLGVYKLIDLIYFFPRSYEDRTNSKLIKDVLNEEFVVIKGIAVDSKYQYIKKGRSVHRVILKDESGIIELVWFNNKFIKNNITVGDELLVYGKVKKSIKLQIVSPEYKKRLKDGPIKGSVKDQILPI